MNLEVALIRGINLGRAKRVAMADLRTLLAELGYTDIRTLLNSGNIIFANPAGEGRDAGARIQSAMVERLGVSARVIVISGNRFKQIVADNPLVTMAVDPARLLVMFLPDKKGLAQVKSLAQLDWGLEAISVGRHALYLWCADGILQSKLLQSVNRVLGDGGTARNWSTVLKLQAALQSEESIERTS